MTEDVRWTMKWVGAVRHLKMADCSEKYGQVRCPKLYQNCDVEQEQYRVCGHLVD